jgi:hypothetical protein
MSFLEKISQRQTVWVTFLVIYSILTLVALYQGSMQSPDTGGYSRWADRLISHKFNYVSFFRDVNFVSPPFFYSLPVTLFAIIKLLMNEQWIIGYQALNLVFLFFALFFYIKIAINLEIRNWLISASLLVFLISMDFLLWPRYILTDTLFVALVMLAIFAVANRTNNNYPSLILILIALFSLLVTRPSSLPFVAVLAFFAFFTSLSQNILIRQTLLVRLGIFVLLSSVLYSFIIMANVSGIIHSKTIDFWYKWIEMGVVIHDRPWTYIVYEATHLGTMKLFAYRMFGFFTPFETKFSLFHNAMNGLALLSCYIIILTMSRYSYNEFERNSNRARAIALLSTLIIAVSIFTSAILMDYDWRYRYPVIAPLILLTTLILDNYLNSKNGEVK